MEGRKAFGSDLSAEKKGKGGGKGTPDILDFLRGGKREKNTGRKRTGAIY